MDRILPLLLVSLLALVSCTNIETTKTPVVVNTRVIPTNTFLPPTSIPTIVPSITPTAKSACDPFNADFCITDGHFILQRPIRPPWNDLIDATYVYGSTANGTRDPHHGVEFSNAGGTPVYASADGTVIFAGPDTEAIYSPWANYYGNLVVIEHEDELYTLYAHLSNLDVVTGQRVSAEDKVGEVGRTGAAIGSHLHFEVRRGDVEDYFATQNPELWLTPANDENGNPFSVLKISVVDQDHRLLKYAEFTIQYYPDPSQTPSKAYYGKTYSSDMLNAEENTAFGELPAGRYRIATIANGKVYERWVEVESGQLAHVIFVVK